MNYDSQFIEKLAGEECYSAIDTILEIFPDSEPDIKNGDVVYLASNENEITGFAHIRENEKGIVMVGLGVRKKHRGKGVGTAIINQFIDDYNYEGKPIFLKVKAENSANEFYFKNGFVPKRFGKVNLMVWKEQT